MNLNRIKSAIEKHCYIHSDFYRTPINIILLLIASNYFEGVGVCAYYDVYYMLGVIITRVEAIKLQPLFVVIERFLFSWFLLCFTCRTEYVFDFVAIKFFHVVASRTEVFAWVEFCRLFCQYLAYGCCHCKAAVGVDIDFADS